MAVVSFGFLGFFSIVLGLAVLLAMGLLYGFIALPAYITRKMEQARDE